MPNSWHCRMILDEAWPLFSPTVSKIGRAFEELGYFPEGHASGSIQVTAAMGESQGAVDFEFESLEAAEEILRTHWAWLWFRRHYEPRAKDLPAVGIGLSFVPEEATVSLGVAHDLRPDRVRDVLAAADLEQLFVLLCGRLGPVYGYSGDEWSPMMRSERLGTARYLVTSDFEQELGSEPPPVLYWLNYFSPSYIGRIGDGPFGEVPHLRKTDPNGGVFIQLSGHPWDRREAVLGKDGLYRFEDVPWS